MTKKLSVSDELHTLERAVEGARDLARQAEESDESHTLKAQPRIGAILDLVAARLHDFGRVVRGEVDPGLFVAPHSAVVDGAARQPPDDVELAPWVVARRTPASEIRGARSRSSGRTRQARK